jgi:hypothetical protein
VADHPPLSSLPAEQILQRAVEYRRMAATASTAEARDALMLLAERLERLAEQRRG